jgi:23S rRNA (adenine2503-C2)-methyltransferase
MTDTPDKINLLSMDRTELGDYFESLGEKPFRADQLFKWIYQGFETDFEQMNNLSKVLRVRLAEVACVHFPRMEQVQIAKDGTRKWLMRLHDGNGIEVVLIPEEDRATLCISSQVGCSLNCTFCATARQGFNRNLDAGEIVGQVWQAWHQLEHERKQSQKFSGGAVQTYQQPGKDPRPITNIVLMGMGEPLLNYDQVTRAIRILLDDLAFGLSRRRITLSTAGVVPGMQRLSKELPVSLAVSLHATDDALRNTLVPLNKKYPIDILLQACRDYVEGRARERITFEYLMLDGINDSDAQAYELAKLLETVPAKVNLIPFNPVENVPYKRSGMRRVNAFREILMQNGIITVTRKTRGDDIDAACGQLVGRVDDRTKRSARLKAESSVGVNITVA